MADKEGVSLEGHDFIEALTRAFRAGLRAAFSCSGSPPEVGPAFYGAAYNAGLLLGQNVALGPHGHHPGFWVPLRAYNSAL